MSVVLSSSILLVSPPIIACRQPLADAVDAGYETRVLIDLTAPVHEDKLDDVVAKLEDDGVEVVEVL